MLLNNQEFTEDLKEGKAKKENTMSNGNYYLFFLLKVRG